MTDFISELEAELLAAARRRAAARPRRSARLRVPWLRPVMATAVVVLMAAAAVLVVTGLDQAGTGDERAVPPGANGAGLILPAALPPAACEQRDQQVATGGVADSPLSVFARKRVAADAVPTIRGDWLPATTIRPGESRRVGDVHLVPADGIRADGACVPADEHDGGSGVCILVATTGLAVRCFDDATIAAGRAVALTGPNRVHGIAPDGVRHLKLEWSGGAADADVRANVYTARTAGLQEGDAVRVIVQRPAQGCVPSAELLGRVPVLGGPRGDDPPAGLEQAMERYGAREAWRRWARLAVADRDLELWVAPSLPCDNDRRQVEQACIVPIRPGVEPRPLCVRPDGEPMWMVIPGGEGAAFAGLRPGGVGRVTVSRARSASVTMSSRGGAFGGVLPQHLGDGENIEVTYREPADVAILNATHDEGLAQRIGGRLPGVELIGNFPEQRERSTVLFADEQGRRDAEDVARRLGIEDVRRTPPETPTFAEGIRVIVVVGADMRGS